MKPKQTLKKPTKNQAQALTVRSTTKPGVATGKISSHRFPLAKIFYVVVYTVVVALLVAGTLRAVGWQYVSVENANAPVSVQPVPPSLSQNTMRVNACSDSIASIGSYTYSTKYFFDLQQEGYRLADTLSQQASSGRDFTDDDCTRYFAVRATHSSAHIILQLFTRDKSGGLLPYQYKDLKPETCYFNEDTKRTVCPNAPVYGIFVKD